MHFITIGPLHLLVRVLHEYRTGGPAVGSNWTTRRIIADPPYCLLDDSCLPSFNTAMACTSSV